MQTISATSNFFYFMAKYPEVQKKAQAEIDGVLEMKRLPEYDDRQKLPYIDALFREIMRMAPPLPFALPHASMEDDYYDGYLIPKGTNHISFHGMDIDTYE